MNAHTSHSLFKGELEERRNTNRIEIGQTRSGTGANTQSIQDGHHHNLTYSLAPIANKIINQKN
jgi:hypothetical protein